METLPKDMMDELVNKLEGKDLIHMCSISNRLRAICDDKFWSMKIKQLLLDEKNVDPEELKAIFKINNLKLLYYYLYRRDQLKIPLDTKSKLFIDAVRVGNTEVVKLLLEDPRINPADDNNLAIGLASQNGYIEIVKLLLKDPRVDPSADEDYAIRMSSERGKTEVVRLLLKDDRVDPSAYNNWAIRWAIHERNTEVARLLLEDRRVDPSALNNYALRWAKEKGYTEIVDLLLKDKREKNI